MMFARRSSKKKLFFLIVVLFGITIFSKYSKRSLENNQHTALRRALESIVPINMAVTHNHSAIVEEYYRKRREFSPKMSNLARILFLNEKRPPPRDKIYKILIHYKGERLEARHLYYFGDVRHEPFEFCEVNNCFLTYDNKDLKDADAVVFHLHAFQPENQPPTNVVRPPYQRWIFLSDESPLHTFLKQNNDWRRYSGIFNWSMMWRMETDVSVPYGRIVPLETPIDVPPSLSFQKKFELLVPHAKDKRRDVLVAIMTSNCRANNRIQYITELGRHIQVDVYGACGSDHLREICPWKGYGHECQELKNYLFYLSFHNSNCKGYITEKLFTHALKLGNIPVYMGMNRNLSNIFIPPNSYIHVDDFAEPKDLAAFIHYINDTFEENYLKFHEWRRDFQSLSEDGYMGAKSYHYCRICEALNYNDDSPKVYGDDELDYLLDPNLNCYKPKW